MRSLLLLCPLIALTLVLPVEAQTVDSTWSMRGSFQLSVNGYNAYGIAQRREPLRYTASFRPVFVKNSWRIPVEVLLFNVGIGSDFQFMRFGIHPSWSWGKLHLGHTNMNLSKFTLSGRTLFGVGAELNPGILRFAGFVGTSNQSPTSFLANATDPQAFQQNIYTFKIGIGTRNNCVDLLFLSGKDVQETVDSSRIILDQYPEENVVVALRTEHYLFKKKWFIGGEYAMAGLTANQNSQELLEENFPLLSQIWEPKSSSNVSDAIEAFLGYRDKLFSARFSYQRVSPGFRTFGAYFIQNDLETFDLNFSIRLLKRKLRIKAKGGLMRNNLADNRALESIRGRGLFQVTYTPSRKWSVFLNYSNYQTEQILQGYEQQDSLRTGIVSNSLNGSVQYLFGNQKQSRQNLRLSAGYFVSSNRQDFERSVSATKNYNAALNYQLITSIWEYTLGVDYLGFEQVLPRQNRFGGKFEVARLLDHSKWRLGLSAQHIWVYRGDQHTTSSFFPGFSCRFRPNPADLFQLSVQYANQSFLQDQSIGFSELQGFFKYQHRFGQKRR